MTRFAPLLLPAVLFALVSPALAVKTEYFKQTTAADFRAGRLKGVAVTDAGEVRLSRALQRQLPDATHVEAIPAIAALPDGGIVYAGFPKSTVGCVKDGKTETLATFDGKTITAIGADAAGRVLVATAGDRGDVWRIERAGAEPVLVFPKDSKDEKKGADKGDAVAYIWAIVADRDEAMLLATGPHGCIYEVRANADSKRLAKLGASNVTALIAAGDTLYAGTDGEGLVYKIDRAGGKATLLFDAAEADVVSLALAKNGDLLAATSDARPSPAANAPVDTGRPESPPAASLPTEPPPAPVPADPQQEVTPAPLEAGDETATSQPAMPQLPAGPVQANVNAGGDGTTGGNAVYKIRPDGFVTEVCRLPVILLCMAVEGDRVLMGTGDNGDLYELRPGDEAAVITAHADGKQINAIATGGDGVPVVAMSNAGGVYRVLNVGAETGSYDTAPLDAGVISRFGAIRVDGDSPADAPLRVSARTGNTSDPDSTDWNPWSAPITAKAINKIDLPPARYVQVRVQFDKAPADASATLRGLSVAYQKPNVAPRVSSVTVAPAGDAANPQNLSINWTAEDANGDALRYTLSYRVAGRGDWVELARDLEAANFVWPGKQAADGRYDFRVVASDAADNVPGEGRTASRVSAPVTIDNTAPVIGDVSPEVGGDQPAVKLRVVDRGGTVASLAYSVDRAALWQKCLPDDTISDSPEERYTIPLTGLGKGRRTLTVRATDENGNAAFEVVGVTLP